MYPAWEFLQLVNLLSGGVPFFNFFFLRTPPLLGSDSSDLRADPVVLQRAQPGDPQLPGGALPGPGTRFLARLMDSTCQKRVI